MQHEALRFRHAREPIGARHPERRSYRKREYRYWRALRVGREPVDRLARPRRLRQGQRHYSSPGLMSSLRVRERAVRLDLRAALTPFCFAFCPSLVWASDVTWEHIVNHRIEIVLHQERKLQIEEGRHTVLASGLRQVGGQARKPQTQCLADQVPRDSIRQGRPKSRW